MIKVKDFLAVLISLIRDYDNKKSIAYAAMLIVKNQLEQLPPNSTLPDEYMIWYKVDSLEYCYQAEAKGYIGYER